MEILKSIARAALTKSAKEGLKRAQSFIKKRNKGSNQSSKAEKNNKEQPSKSEPEKGPKNPNAGEIEKNWTEEIQAERGKGMNAEVGRARGRALGDLDKTENAPTSVIENEPNADDKIQEIESSIGGLKEETEKRAEEAKKSYEEKIGEKKIDKILEEGKSEEGKSWADKIRPDNDLEFQSLESEEGKTQTINFLKEESSGYFMPEPKQEMEIPLDAKDKEKVIDLINDKNQNGPLDILKNLEADKSQNEYKIDAHKAVIKGHDEIQEIKEETFFDEVYRDEMAVEELREMESGGDFDMDMDAGGPDFD